MEASAEMTNKILELVALIIFSGIVFGKVSRLIKLPDVVLFILAGIILGPQMLNLVNIDKYPGANQFILTFGAAYILYDGGREIELKVLNKVKLSVELLSTIGVAISTFITGYIAYIALGIEPIYGFLLGAVIASTDPSVLVPLFKSVKINDKLKQTIISESAFNDAAGAIITFAILDIILKGSFSIKAGLLNLLITSFGGIIVGTIIGFIATYLVAEKNYGVLKEYPSEMAIVMVISAYVIASKLGFSGYMAVFLVGMVCGNKKMLNFWIPEEYYQTHMRFKEVLTIILRMAIFILLGTHVDFGILVAHWKEALAIVGALIFVSRPISVFFSVIFDRAAGWNFKEIVYLMWVRETGVIPAALAGMLVTMNLKNSAVISSVTFMAILITLTFQASTSGLLAKLLKLDKA